MTIHDAVVVGGGVVGAAAAYHLVREGVRTLLIDRHDVGRATDAGAGILSTVTAADVADPVERFRALAAAYYPVLIEALEAAGAGDHGYAGCGALTVAATEDEIASFERVRAGTRPWRQAGDGCTEISPAEAKRRFPPLSDVHRALYSARGARVDGRLLTAALRRAAVARGLEVREGAVDAVLVEDGRARGVQVGDQRIDAGHVVIAGGAWSNALCGDLGLHLPVAPQRGQIVHLELGDTDTSSWPIVVAFRGHYLVPWDDHRVVVGATRETGSGCQPRSTVEGVMAVLREALRVAPGLATASIREIRVGLRPACSNGRPILGAAPGIANLLLATGHGPSGLQLGPFSGKVIAGVAAHGVAEADIGPFDPGRFA